MREGWTRRGLMAGAVAMGGASLMRPAFGQSARDSVLYIDIERKHPDGNQPTKLDRIKSASGCKVSVFHYTNLINNPAAAASMHAENVLAWFISGNMSEWSDYSEDELTALKSWLKSNLKDMPLLAVCGGHQLIAMAFGGTVAHMSCVTDEEGTITEDNCPEAGGKCLPITLEQAGVSDPLFKNLSSKEFTFYHHDEVTKPAPGFVHLASRPTSKHQVLKRSGSPAYTMQFHPELPSNNPVAGTDEGPTLLGNFFAIARDHWSK